MGFGEKGLIVNTDFDTVSLSNLNRQFLFSNKDISKSKSVVAAEKIKNFNPKINLISFESKIEEDDLQNSNEINYYLEKTDLLFAAVDNVGARKILDQYALFYKIPYFEAGINGVSGNTSIIIPDYSATYGEVYDSLMKTKKTDVQKKSCTVKNFPYMFVHCIDWALNLFEDFFSEKIYLFNQYMSKKDQIIFDSLSSLDKERSLNYFIHLKENNILQLIIEVFNDLFFNDINYLLSLYQNANENFWSGLKTRPEPIKFDIEKDDHLLFAYYLSKILCKIIDINLEIKDINTFKNALEKNIKYRESELEPNYQLNNEEQYFNFVKKSKLLLNENTFQFTQLSYDYQNLDFLNFVYYTSLLRSKNYKIHPESIERVKVETGKFQPSVITSSACVVGFNCLELLKLISNGNNNSKELFQNLRQINFNLSCNIYTYNRLKDTSLLKIKDDKNLVVKNFSLKDGTPLTRWFILELNNIKLQEVIQIINEKFDYRLIEISYNKNQIFYVREPIQEELEYEIIDLIEKKGFEIPKKRFIKLVITFRSIRENVKLIEDDEEIIQNIVCFLPCISIKYINSKAN